MSLMEEFEPGHNDRVTVLNVNYDGTRILTASIDHRVKVWNRNKVTGERSLVDTFSAHDADIRDAKFLHPTIGSHLATIGNDLKFHLWSEDPSQAPNSGRRFRRTCTIQSTPRVPFVSLDIKTVDHVYTYLALIDRQGLLSIYEPSHPDELKDWTLVDQFNVCTPPPSRGEETSFKVRWDPNPTPLPYINSLSDDRKQLSLVVSALNEVKIYRSVPDTSEQPFDDNNNGASQRLVFCEAAKFSNHNTLVRDVQWAPFNVRGFDRFAVASKDGAVRILEMTISENIAQPNTTSSTNNTGATQSRANLPIRHAPQSSLTSAIAGRTGNSQTSQSQQTGAASQSTSIRSYSFPFTHHITQVADLSHAHSDAWAVAWDGQGQVLLSNGADGVSKMWRRSVAGGQWLLFADQAVEVAGSDGLIDGDTEYGLEDERIGNEK